MPRPETTQTQPPFDLEGYNPYTAFVEPLKQAINQPIEAPVEWSAQQQPLGPVEITSRMLQELHPEALAPAIQAVLEDFRPPKRRYYREELSETEKRTPQEKEVYDFLHRITTEVDPYPMEREEEERTAEERLAEKYHISEGNQTSYHNFNLTRTHAGSFEQWNGNLIEHWQTLQAREATEVPDDQTIATHWRTLRTLLAQEKAREQITEVIVKELSEDKYPYLYPNETFGEISPQLPQSTAEDEIATQIKEQDTTREARVQALVATVHTLRAIPPQASARVLMEHILTEDEQQEIIQIQQTQTRAKQTATKFYTCASHRDNEFKTIKKTDINGIRDAKMGLRSIKDIVIKDYDGIPEDMSRRLKNPEADTIKTFTEYFSDYDLLNNDFLIGYLVDVATVLLMNTESNN